MPWHVYSNNFNPHLCPFLTWAKYLFNAGKINSWEKLFPGEFQYEIFLKIFFKSIRENAETFNRFEVQVRYIRSLSTYKEKIALVSSGCAILPLVSYIFLWTCWSMGFVKDRCIHLKRPKTIFLQERHFRLIHNSGICPVTFIFWCFKVHVDSENSIEII